MNTIAPIGVVGINMDINALALIFATFSTPIFFSIMAFLGLHYEGSESSPAFIVYNAVLFVALIALFLIDAVKQKFRYSRPQMIAIFIPVIFTFMFFIGKLFEYNRYDSNRYFLLFILWIVPVILTAADIKPKSLYRFLAFLEPLAIFFTFALLASHTRTLLKESSYFGLGGDTPQAASYLAALSYGINLHYIILGKGTSGRFSILFYLRFVLFPLQLSIAFLSGGRGGIALILIYTAYLLISFLRTNVNISPLRILWPTTIVITTAIIVSLLTKNLLISMDSPARLLYFMRDGFKGLLVTGREAVYSAATELILRKPIYGYGLFNWGMPSNPHNIFLDILLNGGIIYLLVWICIFLRFIRRLTLLTKKDSRFRLLAVVFLYPIVMLMFSGTYLITPSFWMVIVVTLCSYIPLEGETNGNFQFKKKNPCKVSFIKYI